MKNKRIYKVNWASGEVRYYDVRVYWSATQFCKNCRRMAPDPRIRVYHVKRKD